MSAAAPKLKLRWVILSLIGGTAAAYLLTGWAARAADEKTPDRFFELRKYVAADGKFDQLHSRFRDHTNKLFQKHGMTLIGYWVVAEGADPKEPLTADQKNTLVYILAYPSKEAREKSWKGFMSDPEWQAVYKESQKNGSLTKDVKSQFLTPTDYSPIK
ncbi:MAG TPA: NIPSNAP family protein [Pirellulales bacterium]